MTVLSLATSTGYHRVRCQDVIIPQFLLRKQTQSTFQQISLTFNITRCVYGCSISPYVNRISSEVPRLHYPANYPSYFKRKQPQISISITLTYNFTGDVYECCIPPYGIRILFRGAKTVIIPLIHIQTLPNRDARRRISVTHTHTRHE